MDFAEIERRGLVLLGCGKMGGAMLQGWLAAGLTPSAVTVLDPKPSDWLTNTGVRINDELPASPAFIVIAVKPQMVSDALPALQACGNGDTVYLSIAAGTTIATFKDLLGDASPIVRAMPNTPAAIGQGIAALIGDEIVSDSAMAQAEQLLSVIGQVVRLSAEREMDAVTAVSGSGPAYVFHLIETLAAAGEKEGLPAELAMTLAKATVAGAGALALAAEEEPSQLRVNVTSPGGTTAAALTALMDDETGFPPLLREAVKRAANRSRELAG